jgi:CheY-like chemotaxis protein
MESIGQLTGGVAHDFNNLLQVISGNLQLLAREVAGNGRAEVRVQNALTGVSRGAKLAAQLLAFGRRQPLEPKVVNIGRFIRGMDDLLRRTLGEEIEIETTVSGGLWNTFADPGQIENALLNLAINARDAMNGRGRLTIEVGNAFLNDDYTRSHPDVSPGQYVLLAVTDTGTGIDPAIIDRVFEPFFTTKAEGRGTGLGLSMVYGFAKQSGGHVKIYSEQGMGTTVKLYLPRSTHSEDLLVEVSQQPAIGGSETVLVVEDDEQVRATAVEMLTDLGYRVLKAADADSALAVVESGVPIDVLFTDVVMPGNLRSPELARRARERLPEIAVLFTSGYTENAIVHGGRLDEGVHLLPKPYTREALSRKIRHVIGNQQQRKVAQAQAPVRSPPQGRSLTILLVEDDDLIRMNTADMLHELGCLAIEAASAEEALEVLGRRRVDVLITDVRLPGMSGFDLAREARAQHDGIGVVFATGRDHLDGEMQGALLLRKPYDGTGLASCLQQLAKGRGH